MSLYKGIVFSRLEQCPDSMELVCDDWHLNNESDGWPHNPPKPSTVGEFRALYKDLAVDERIVITDMCCDTCKKSDFTLINDILHMEIY